MTADLVCLVLGLVVGFHLGVVAKALVGFRARRRLERELTRVLQALLRAVEEHRRIAVVTCPEDCWCWEAEALVAESLEGKA